MNDPIDEIDCLKSPQSIAVKFARKFSVVTGYVLCDRGVNFRARDQFAQAAVDLVFSIVDIQVAVGKLNTRLGFDGIHSNHLKFTSADILRILAQFFNCCFINNHIPNQILKGVITPTVKDKNEDVHSSYNYREIMNSSCLFKLFEYCLLTVLQSHTSISPLQFGYKPNTSTVSVTTILIETINKFLEEDSLVYACFFFSQ